MKYEKGSFITVPHRSSILGIGAGPQALYMWLCSYANMEGECFPSRKTLAESIGCSERAIDTYIDELVVAGLVRKEPRYNENKQLSNNYYLPLGVQNLHPGVAEFAPTPSQNLRTELNPVLTQSIYTGETGVSQRNYEIVTETEKPRKERKDTTYLQVFELWGEYPLHWRKNVTEIEAAKNLLIESNLSDMAIMLINYQHLKSISYCPSILKPSDLDRKWDNLIEFKKKHG